MDTLEKNVQQLAVQTLVEKLDSRIKSSGKYLSEHALRQIADSLIGALATASFCTTTEVREELKSTLVEKINKN